MKHAPAYAYFISFRTYGTWLHGDARDSVDRKRNKINSPKIKASEKLSALMKSSMNESYFILIELMRETVLHSIVATCEYNHWQLLCAHVRTDHVHLVLRSLCSKEEVMQKIKCYATKALKKDHAVLRARKHFWSRHGSTRNIWSEASLFPALYYVVRRQGEPMALFYDKKYYDMFDEQLYEAYFL